jgi:hypothetical protein
MDDSIKRFIKGARIEIFNFALIALKSGAVNVGKELANVTSDEKQPSSSQLGTYTNAVKTGIMGTGQELMEIGRELIEARSSEEQNSEMSEEPTWTKKSVEEK